MDEKLFFGARSSLFVSTPALAAFGILSVAGAVFRLPLLCGGALFLLLLCLLSRLWGEAALGHVEAGWQSQPTALFPAGEVTVRIRLRNRKGLPVPWLEVLQLLDETAPLVPADPEAICHVQGAQARLEGAKEEDAAFLHKKFTFVMGWEELTWESRWIARRRGVFYPGQMQLRAGDGFGLTQKERAIDPGTDRLVAVYPALQPVSADRLLRDLWDASSSAKGFLEDPTVIQRTRDYQRTDSARRINWRLTAKTQRPIVNTYETILPKAACFLLDGQSFPPGLHDALEDTLSILASLLFRLQDNGIRCGLVLPASQREPARVLLRPDGTPLEEMLLALAGYTPLTADAPADGQTVPPPPAVFPARRILSLQNAGRFYYLCYTAEALEGQTLLSRLDPARTTLLPYAAPDTAREGTFGRFPVLPLTSLKKEAAHDT